MHRLARAFSVLVLLSAGAAGVVEPAYGATHTDATAAALALAKKAAALDALGAFGNDGFAPLRQALQDLPLTTGTKPRELARDLESADRAAAGSLRALDADGRPLGREVTATLTELSPDDLRAAEAGRTISTQPQIYLAALEELALHDGAPPTSATPPDPQAVHDALASDLSSPVGVEPSHPGKATWPVPLAIAAIATLAAIAGIVSLRRRRGRPGARANSAGPPVFTTTPASMHGVLEASRRLTAGTTADDIDRAVVREMLGLVPGRAGALLTAADSGLQIAHETQPGLLAPAGFGAGVVARAVRTQQLVTESVVTDASFTRGGIEVAVAPLITDNRVNAVMVVIRDGEPFGAGERLMLTSLAPVAAAALQSAARNREAVDASMRDPLTGVGNRRELDARLPAILAASSGASTAFVMVDLDHFKSVNDTYGHPAGDALLRGVCAVISAALRPTDAVYRYGGEEFCLLLPGTTRSEAQQIAERVRASIAAASFDVGGGRTLTVTASLGVAATEDSDGATLVARADAALYDAKHSGRDRVCLG